MLNAVVQYTAFCYYALISGRDASLRDSDITFTLTFHFTDDSIALLYYCFSSLVKQTLTSGMFVLEKHYSDNCDIFSDSVIQYCVSGIILICAYCNTLFHNGAPIF